MRLYSRASIAEKSKGPLHQLKTILNHSAVPTDSASNMKAAEDFLLVVFHGHVVAAANAACPIPKTPRAHQLSVSHVADAILDSFVNMDYSAIEKDSSDGVVSYACELLFIGLLWHGFHDAIREGDGQRILVYWRYLLIIFKASKRKKL